MGDTDNDSNNANGNPEEEEDLIHDFDPQYVTELEEEMIYFYDSNIPMLETENMMECIQDGNSLFRLFAIKFFDVEDNHYLVRVKAVEVLKHDPTFRDMTDGLYLESMKTEGTPGTPLEAWALAKMLKLKLLLVYDGQKVIHDYQFGNTELEKEKVFLTLMFGSWNMAKNYEEVDE
jgi:hypothetical protein